MTSLRPFWRYYGGKWRATQADAYPRPLHRTIIEPFAGAAGYSCRWFDRDVILVEKYATIAAIWRYLIGADPAEIRAIPEVDDVAELPEWVPQPARWLVGFSMNSSASTPRRTLSAGRRMLRAQRRQYEGWTTAMRERVASQVTMIRHWRVIEGDYTASPDAEATWFIDPPYSGGGRTALRPPPSRLRRASGVVPRAPRAADRLRATDGHVASVPRPRPVPQRAELPSLHGSRVAVTISARPAR